MLSGVENRKFYIFIILIFLILLAKILNLYNKYEKVEESVSSFDHMSSVGNNNQLQEHLTHFQALCPSMLELQTLPKSCKNPSKNPPKYQKTHNSSFYPIWAPNKGPFNTKNLGPSEQMQGLKHIFMLTAILGKSLYMSNFSIHRSDESSKFHAVPFGVRVDVENLCGYLKIEEEPLGDERFFETELDDIILFSDLNLKKEEGPDKGYFINDTIKEYLHKYTSKPHTVKLKKPKLINENMEKFKEKIYEHYPKSRKENITAAFERRGLLDAESKSPKIIGISHSFNYIFGKTYKLIDDGGAYVYREDHNSINGESKPPNMTVLEAKEELNMDWNLVADSYLATAHPKFIKFLAEKFLESIGVVRNGNENEDFTVNSSNMVYDFTGIHFRFNPGDFFLSDFMKTKPELTRQKGLDLGTVKNLQKSLKNSTYFYEKLYDFLNLTRREHANDDSPFRIPHFVYIASPINISKKFKSKAEKYKKLSIFTTLDLINFLEPFSNNCQILKNYFGDILSTIEKEIMILSKLFLRSRPSSWSFNVQGHRNFKLGPELVKYDRVVFDVFGIFEKWAVGEGSLKIVREQKFISDQDLRKKGVATPRF